MGAWGAIIMSFFGAVFVALTMYWQWHLTGPALAAPLIGFAAIGLAAAWIIRLPGEAIVPSPAAERAIMWSSVGEGVGLFVAANLVVNLHQPWLMMPAVALVVGLHFLPIAYAASFRPFYLLGSVLIAAALVGIAVPAPLGGGIAGLAAGLALWVAAVGAVRRDLLSKRASMARQLSN
jgi:hypothetical protein